ncbi:MAG: alpha/beta hydrolase [Firmicutes bacterium]|nr:alpha/beta hydrolase [Bacillota bacterium]MBP3901578.1 alpha/beta hydrolase [Blautia sp.]
MVIREFGTEHKEHLLFFQGSCEPWIHFTPSAEALAKHFHVLLLTPDGHDPEEQNDFISVERTVDQAVEWLHSHGIDRLDAVYGLSFGGGMVIRLLATQAIPVDKAIIDAGTAPYQYPKWVCKLIGVRDYLMLKIGRSSVKFMEMNFPPDRFTLPGHDAKKEYREIQQYLKGYSNKTIWNIFWSANNYAVPKTAPQMDTKIQFWVGTDEWGSRFRDLKWAMKYLPQMEVVKIPHMMHGEYVMIHSEDFAERAFAFLQQEEQES